VGWVIDRGRASGDVSQAWQNGLWLIAGAAAFGAAMTWFVREPRRPLPSPA
jgi:hypothetical protein